MAEQYNAVSASCLLLRGEHAPDLRLDAEQGKEAGGRGRSEQPFRNAAAGKVGGLAAECRNLFEQLILLLPFGYVGVSERTRAGVAQIQDRRPQNDEVIGILVGKRPKQRCIENRKNSGRSPD